MKRTLLAGIAAGGLLLGGTAIAAEKPGQWYVAPMASVIWADNDRLVDDDVGAALSVGRAVSDMVNIELYSFGYQLEGIDDTDYWGMGLDVMSVFYRDARISPYLSFGVGWNKKNREIAEDRDDWYTNAAFGLLTDLTQNGSMALRTEVRYRIDSDKGGLFSDDYNDLMFNVGLQIPFGQPYAQPAAAPPPPPPPPPPPADSDGDGVPDSRDQCPGTPAGVAVNADGCPPDSDGDGVPDYLDLCPGTTPGVKVDETGCFVEVTLDLGFEFNSAALTAADRAQLDTALGNLRNFPPEVVSSIRLQIAGHTDSIGNENFNQALSERRAASVRDYLAAGGFPASQMTVVGYGETRPIADNGTEQGRAMNRRVVVTASR